MWLHTIRFVKLFIPAFDHIRILCLHCEIVSHIVLTTCTCTLYTICCTILYSRKYWRSLNLAVLPQMTFLTLLADLNLAIWYGIAIRTSAQKKKLAILIWQLKGIPPNRQIFGLYGITLELEGDQLWFSKLFI